MKKYYKRIAGNMLKVLLTVSGEILIEDPKYYGKTKTYHYRDKLEYSGCYGMIEIKLGNGQIDEAANNLLKVASRIDTEKQTKPAFLMVLTGTEYAYKRDDGVLVVPVGCLKN